MTGVPLSLLVIKRRELHSPRLVGSAEVLVDQRQTEVLDVDGAVDRLDGGVRHGAARIRTWNHRFWRPGLCR
jgi:hypothetical protein